MKQELINVIEKNKPLQRNLFSFKDKNPFECLPELLIELKKAIEEKKPFSMIRVGDGEGRILSYPNLFEEKIYLNQVLTYQFGAGVTKVLQDMYGEQFIETSMLTLKEFILQSIIDADIIGAPSWLHFRAELDEQNITPQAANSICLEYVATCNPESKLIFDAFIFKPFHSNGYFKQLLSGLDRLCVISHTDMSSKIESAFNVGKCTHVKIPGHQSFMQSGEYHFPIEYKNVLKKLSVHQTGDVYLVAAGYLGKYYCSHIKQSGGIAIDIGSIFDGWCGTGRIGAIQNKDHLL